MVRGNAWGVSTFVYVPRLLALYIHEDFAYKCQYVEQFAFTEASYVVVRLLQHFDRVENMDPVKEIKLHTAIENRSGTGVKVRLHEADGVVGLDK